MFQIHDSLLWLAKLKQQYHLPILQQDPEDPNMIKENYEEYVVEFSVTVADPVYSKLLSEPEAPQYSDVAQELTDKVRPPGVQTCS